MSQSAERHDLQSTLDLVDFRVADLSDIGRIMELFQLFFDESDLPSLGLRTDRDKAREWLRRVLPVTNPHIIAVEKDSWVPVGVLSYAIDDRGLATPYAFLDKFYVRKEWRLSGVARVLLQLAMDSARDDGAVAFRAGISSGVGFGKNLFLKNGFHETAGSTLLARRL
jgi:GNAT superfamily N-acetyltransferase